ncbi:glycosyltransferase family 4 protein [Pleurocapsa sp. PCC 7319]|uniref:glycosyltransferase family 4 protein n=1 Tax=Pleurocapsa sp. PCC 7319 TaxID=118161 RepID=UPI00034D72B3|nr:glycosyltransferase family 4 protein [Pleurocapsa sp. PCC 7319]
MKILLSAYACEPNKGSEPGVGWHWAKEIAHMGHEVWVITRANNQAVIDEALSLDPRSNLHFVYYDLPIWVRHWKKIPGGVYLYYLFWQWGAYRVAHSLTQKVNFDWVHHITFGVLRMPSFMAFLGIPFICGPLGGGENAPQTLRSSFPLRGYILDWLRDLSNWLIVINPLLQAMYQRSSIILCKTKETKAAIPQSHQDKCRLCLEIGIEPPNKDCQKLEAKNPRTDGEFRLLYVGRLVYWKGLHLGLQAFAQFQKQMPNSRLTVVGKGMDEAWLHRMAEKLEIDTAIDWIDWMPQKQVLQLYSQHDVFLFPSLHDSSGNVVLEALSHSLPVVCLNLGGPGVMVNNSCGRVIDTADLSSAIVIQKLSDALGELASDRNILKQLSEEALICSRQYHWHQLVNNFYTTLEPYKAITSR